jgi:hypothetical protein
LIAGAAAGFGFEAPEYYNKINNKILNKNIKKIKIKLIKKFKFKNLKFKKY